MSKRKAISPVVATALLLVVAVVAVVGFQGWFQQYSSDILTSTEQQGSLADLEINSISGSGIYVRNSAETSLNITELKVDGVSCNVSSTLSGKDTSFIDVGPCLDEKEGEVEVVLISSGGDLQTKKLYMGYRWEQAEIPAGTRFVMNECPSGWNTIPGDFTTAGGEVLGGYYPENDSAEGFSICSKNSNVSTIQTGTMVIMNSCSGNWEDVGWAVDQGSNNLSCYTNDGEESLCRVCESQGFSIQPDIEIATNTSCPSSWTKTGKMNLSGETITCDGATGGCWFCSPQ